MDTIGIKDIDIYKFAASKKKKNEAMGLDISFGIIDDDKYYQKINEQKIDLLKIGLSREFCNFQFRKDVVLHEPELQQIGKLTQIDVSPIEQMSWYLREREIDDQIVFYDTKEEKEKFIKQVEETNKQVIGNLKRVKKTIESLISKLSKIEDLPNKLLDTNFDTLNNERYFSNFNEDLGKGYIGNNFGQDLRNLLKLIEFAESIEAETIFFEYG